MCLHENPLSYFQKKSLYRVGASFCSQLKEKRNIFKMTWIWNGTIIHCCKLHLVFAFIPRSFWWAFARHSQVVHPHHHPHHVVGNLWLNENKIRWRIYCEYEDESWSTISGQWYRSFPLYYLSDFSDFLSWFDVPKSFRQIFLLLFFFWESFESSLYLMLQLWWKRNWNEIWNYVQRYNWLTIPLSPWLASSSPRNVILPSSSE